MALKKDTDAVRRTVDALSGDRDRSSRRGKQAADELQKRALAATAGPDNGEELPVEDIELQRLQRLDFTVAAAIRLRHAQHANQWRRRDGVRSDLHRESSVRKIREESRGRPNLLACLWSRDPSRRIAPAGRGTRSHRPSKRAADGAWRSPWCDRARSSA